MRVVVVHDYVTQRGGAERVTLDLLRAFPGSRLVTSCWNRAASFPEFAEHEIKTLWIDRLPFLRHDPRRAFPFLAAAFDSHVVHDADLVICSSSGWSHRVRSEAPKLVYCHNPARWLYQPDDYFPRLPSMARRATSLALEPLRRTDVRAARGASAYVANSTVVAERVRKTYDIDVTIVPPARGLSPHGPQEPVIGVQPGFLLTVSRPRGYKHTDVVRRAVAQLSGERLVVVGDIPQQGDPHGVTACGRVSDAQLRWLYANAAGLVAVSYEDFGLTPVEAQAFGVPAVVLRSGGYLDSTVEGETGIFVDEATPEAVAAGIRQLRSSRWDSQVVRRHGERYSPASLSRQLHDVADRLVASA
jgi:glycosyltransferase involved in cell wall biosynthesis